MDAQWVRPVREQGCFVSRKLKVESGACLGTDEGGLHGFVLSEDNGSPDGMFLGKLKHNPQGQGERRSARFHQEG